MTDINFDDYAEMLPAYVNGTLALADRARLQTALAASSQLRAELAEIEAISSLVKAGAVSDPSPVDMDARLNRLLAQTQTIAQERPIVSAEPSLWQKCKSWLATPSLRPAYAMALIAVVAIQGGVLTQVLRQPSPAYGTLSGGEEKLAVKPQILIQYKDDASVKDVSALLTKEGLRVVGGPIENSYELGAKDTAFSPEALDACLIRLKASPLVSFAEKAA
jgi:anti-sigma factor RsiW